MRYEHGRLLQIMSTQAHTKTHSQHKHTHSYRLISCFNRPFCMYIYFVVFFVRRSYVCALLHFARPLESILPPPGTKTTTQSRLACLAFPPSSYPSSHLVPPTTPDPAP